MSTILSLVSKYRKRILYFIVGVVVVSAVVASVMFFSKPRAVVLNSPKAELSSTQDDGKSSEQLAREKVVTDNLAESDIQSAIKVFDEGIASSPDKQDQSDQYARMAVLLYDEDPQGSKAMILEYSYKAEDLYPSARTATLIYDMETRYENHDAAQKYLAIIAERAGNDSKDLE